MKTEEYGGESPAKKIARNTVWHSIYLAKSAQVGGSRAIVLAGPENQTWERETLLHQLLDPELFGSMPPWPL